MISEEIKSKARELNMNPDIIEKDYVIGWLLYGIWRAGLWKVLAFKGGTCIKKAYIKDYRFSEDLDFNLLEGMSIEKLEESIIKAVEYASTNSEIEFFPEEIKIKERLARRERIKGKLIGYEVGIPYLLLRKGRKVSKPRIRVDITLKEFEPILDELKVRNIFHEYSDALKLAQVQISAYSLEEIFAEKVRTLFERVRPRDLYDVWRLWYSKDLDEDKVTELVPLKFDVKGVKPDLMTFENKKEFYRRSWESIVGVMLWKRVDFESVWDEVIGIVREILNNNP